MFRVVEGFNEWVSMEPTDLSRMIESEFRAERWLAKPEDSEL